MKKLFSFFFTLSILNLISASYCYGNAKGIPRALPGGLLFPQFTQSAFQNASTLPIEKGRAIQANYLPPAYRNASHGYQLSVASSTKAFGLGMGYLGTSGNGSTTHGGFIGTGATIKELFSLGVSLIDTNTRPNLDPDVDIGFDVGLEDGVRAGMVLRNVNHSTALDIGLGFGKKRKYNVEANLGLPRFNQISSSNYQLSLAAGTYVGIFGFGFKTDYYPSSNDYTHQVSGLIWFTENFNTVVSYQTPNQWNLGLTLGI